ncbi:MAG: endonuclease/exonuclease/phosphatase family protein [Verrucomicrobiales bacterium]
MKTASIRLALVAVAAVTFSALPRASAEPEEPREGNFRVLTHNVFYGFSREGEPHHARWLEWMAEMAPDVVSLQELNGYTAERLAAEAEAWGHPHSVILKEEGFPTGLTSRWPLETVERRREGFQHGLLRAKVRGVYVYAIHFHPSDWEHRIREAALLAEDIASLPEEDPLVVLAGDFNGFSPSDRARYEQDSELVPFFERLDARNPRARNLNEGRIDYGGIQAILDQGFVDLHARFRDPAATFQGTFPSELVSHQDHGPDRRLDYIFASANLLDRVRAVELVRDEETARFSDHFPVVADFELEPTKE